MTTTTDFIAELIERLKNTDAEESPHYANAHMQRAADTLTALEAELASRVMQFAEAILHGDDEHRAWLMDAAKAFVAGQELPPPNGKGRAESAEAENARLRKALRDKFCPRPCNGRPFDFEVGNCVDAGECGCGAARTLSGDA